MGQPETSSGVQKRLTTIKEELNSGILNIISNTMGEETRINLAPLSSDNEHPKEKEDHASIRKPTERSSKVKSQLYTTLL